MKDTLIRNVIDRCYFDRWFVHFDLEVWQCADGILNVLNEVLTEIRFAMRHSAFHKKASRWELCSTSKNKQWRRLLTSESIRLMAVKCGLFFLINVKSLGRGRIAKLIFKCIHMLVNTIALPTINNKHTYVCVWVRARVVGWKRTAESNVFNLILNRIVIKLLHR